MMNLKGLQVFAGDLQVFERFVMASEGAGLGFVKLSLDLLIISGLIVDSLIN